MTENTLITDDEIDVRELILTLWRYKWLILGFTLVVAVVVLV